MYFNPSTPNSNQNYIPKFKDAGGYPKHQMFVGMSPIYGVGNTIAMSSSPYALSSSGSTVLSSSSQPWWRPALNLAGRGWKELLGRAKAAPKSYGPESSFGNPFRYIQPTPPEMFDEATSPMYSTIPREQFLSPAAKERLWSVRYGYGDPYKDYPIGLIPKDALFPSERTQVGWLDYINDEGEIESVIPNIPIIGQTKFGEWLDELLNAPPGIKKYGVNPETGAFDTYYDQSITGAEYFDIQPLDAFIKYRIEPNEKLQLDMATVDTKEYMGVFDDEGNLYQVPYNDAYLNDESLTTQEKADMKKEFLKSGTFIDVENIPSNELPRLFNYEKPIESLPENMRDYVYNPKENNWTIRNKETDIPYSTISHAEFKEKYPVVDTTFVTQYGDVMAEREKYVSYTHDMLEELSNQAKPGEQMSIQEMMFKQRNERRARGNK
jgi:hypothetical protein